MFVLTYLFTCNLSCVVPVNQLPEGTEVQNGACNNSCEAEKAECERNAVFSAGTKCFRSSWDSVSGALDYTCVLKRNGLAVIPGGDDAPVYECTSHQCNTEQIDCATGAKEILPPLD